MSGTPEHERKPGPGHEERDASVRAVLWFAAGLVAAVIVVLGLMRWTFKALPTPDAEYDSRSDVMRAANGLPPEPRLQVSAPEDLKRMRAEEDSVLNSYGWVDRQNGVVRIPIERAIDLLVQRGLPPPVRAAMKSPEK